MRRAFAIVIILGLTLCACETVQWPPWQPKVPPPPPELAEDLEQEAAPPAEPAAVPEEGLQLASDQRFPDVPLPVDIKESEKTYVYQSSALRIGRMVYSSRATVNQLAQFYIRECPAADWELKTLVQAEGAELKFTKGAEQLIVRIRDLGVTRGREFELHLTPAESGQ
ncbi:MAG: hypothetical protein JXR94_02905 [Candidatus Hydrogenedentes bacterium]|nr:hypothetical protein [Candidatus Hydrogenedentota bacterium]